jgi:DNA-binding IclR family transcriptional regulator
MTDDTDGGSDGGSDVLKSVVRAFDIVEALEANEGMTMSELADGFDIPRSTAHVYLKTLCETGYVIREGDEYRLGFRFLKHGGYVRHKHDIYQAAKSEVDDLARRTGEVVDFGTVENGRRVLVYKSEGPDGVTQKPVTGDYAHMHMTALGKSMLATMDDDRVSEIVDEHGLPKATQHTIDNRGDLFAELDRTRERGYSIEDEEKREGIRATGTAIERGSERPCAISISGPKSKLTDERIAELQNEIRDSVNVIQIKLQNY